MSENKLQKMKKYLEKNLKKEFISFSLTLYALSVLFVVKSNKSLRFCVNYRKLNVVTKCYESSLKRLNNRVRIEIIFAF